MDIFDLYDAGMHLLSDPAQSWWAAPALWLGDAAFTMSYAVNKPYEGSSFASNMDMAREFDDGVRGFGLFSGHSSVAARSPGHVYVNWVIYSLTDQGTNVEMAQTVHAFLYLAALATAMLIYRACRAPPYLFLLLVLSRTMRELFVSRLELESFVPFLLFAMVLAFQRQNPAFATLVFSFMSSVRVGALAVTPGFMAVIIQSMPLSRAIRYGLLFVVVYLLLALPFLSPNFTESWKLAPSVDGRHDGMRARNWYFPDEKMILQTGSQKYLTAGYIAGVGVFLRTRWLYPMGCSVQTLLRRVRGTLPIGLETSVHDRVTPVFVGMAIFSALVLSMLFSSALNYQNFAYLGWVSPFVLWRARLHPLLMYAICMTQEQAWTDLSLSTSSFKTIIACLAVQVLGVWWGTRHDVPKSDRSGAR